MNYSFIFPLHLDQNIIISFFLSLFALIFTSLYYFFYIIIDTYYYLLALFSFLWHILCHSNLPIFVLSVVVLHFCISYIRYRYTYYLVNCCFCWFLNGKIFCHWVIGNKNQKNITKKERKKTSRDYEK